MSLKIEPASTIKVTLGINPNGPIQWFFTNTCYKRMNKYVPMSDLISKGDLRKNVTITSNSITYEMPYAHYQWLGMREDGSHVINPENYTTPGTGPHWDERMVTAEGEELEKDVQKFASRFSK